MISSQYLKKKKLPTGPGVYMFMGRNKQVLYVGRATSLRDRVRSYLSSDITETRGPKIVNMLHKAKSLDFRPTDSVLEAILLEADLIGKLKPYHNTDSKDDKSWNCVVITDEDFPRLLVIRERDLESQQLKIVFGPFIDSVKLKLVLKYIRRIFPYRDSKCVPLSGKACFNRQIGLCPGVCTGEISKEDYAKNIRNIKFLFEGKKKSLLSALKRDMKNFAKAGQFERAAGNRDAINALNHINDVALISDGSGLIEKALRIEGFDVAHILGDSTVGVMVVIYGGVPDKSGYRKFILKGNHGGDDTSALKELIERRFNHEEWGLPDIVAVDGGKAQKRVAEGAVAVVDEVKRPKVVSVVKDDRHRPKGIIGGGEWLLGSENAVMLADSEAHRFALSFHRKKLRKKSLGF